MPYGASMMQMTESPRMNNFGTNLSLFTGLCPGVFSVHISFASRRIRLQCLSNAFIRPKTLWLFRTFTKTCALVFEASTSIDNGPRNNSFSLSSGDLSSAILPVDEFLGDFSKNVKTPGGRRAVRRSLNTVSYILIH